MKRYLLASAVMIAFVPFKAEAAQIDAAGAAHLKEVFSKYLKNQEEMNEVSGELDIVFEGDVTVEPKGEYYAVILPKVSFKAGEELKKKIEEAAAQGANPQDPAAQPAPAPAEVLPEFSLDFGQTAINAVPDEKPGLWKMTVALPGTMSFGIANEFAMTATIGEQNTSGLLHEASGNFLKLNSVLKNVKFSVNSAGETNDFMVPEIAMNTNLEDDGQGYVTGPSTVRVSGMSFDVPDENVKISLGALNLVASITRYKLISVDEYKTKFISFGEKMKSLQDAGISGQPPSAAQVEELINAFLAINDFEGMSIKYGLENFEVAATPAADAPADELKNLKLAAASIGFGIEGIKSDTSSLNMNFGYSGITVDPVPAGYEGVIPDAVNIDLTAGKIPLQSLWAAGMNVGKAVVANPDTGPMAAMGLMMQVPMMLTQAGTEIAVKDNYVNGKDYKATLNGQVKADPAAVMQFIANLNGRFDGLDELLARIKTTAADPNFPNAYEFNDIASQLEMLKQYGAAAAGPDGKPGYNYDIKVTADGKMTINGQDMPMGGPAPGEETPAAGGAEQPLPY
ncbi:MAG: hypothetical protein KJ017_00705 [Alphaproteobacteria bacterium]|nr:hypothetical protein [Alphaproteobacteria bacterium]